jgi:hypothetical protein
MSDKLETFVEAHRSEFDDLRAPSDLWANIDSYMKAGSKNWMKSKLLSQLIYIGLSAALVVVTIVYFISKEKGSASSTASGERRQGVTSYPKTIKNDTTEKLNEQKPENDKNNLQNSISYKSFENNEILLPDSVNKNTAGETNKDTLRVKQEEELKYVDIDGVERHIFYHISYNYTGRIKNTIFWYTHKELSNTHFHVEHFCWNRWIKREEVTRKGKPGKGNYAGKIEGKYFYWGKIFPHSGENRMRVTLINDSDTAIAVSKELNWVATLTPKVEYTIRKKNREITFSEDTYFELYDSSGDLVDEGRAKIISYAKLKNGLYTLNYDNTTTKIKLK